MKKPDGMETPGKPDRVDVAAECYMAVGKILRENNLPVEEKAVTSAILAGALRAASESVLGYVVWDAICQEACSYSTFQLADGTVQGPGLQKLKGEEHEAP